MHATTTANRGILFRSSVRVRAHCTHRAHAPVSTASSSPSAMDLAHAAAGTAFFFGFERGTAILLESNGSSFPSSVAAIAVLSAAALPVRSGALLQLALGPAASWLRATLPWLLVPAALLPVRTPAPDADVMLRFVLTTAVAVLSTSALTGSVASRLVRKASAAPLAGGAAPCARSAAAAAAAAAAHSSLPLAAATVVVGSLGTAMLLLLRRRRAGGAANAGLSRGDATPCEEGASREEQASRDEETELAAAWAPCFAALTFAAHAAAARLTPPPVRRFVPPFVAAAAALGVITYGLDGSRGVLRYVDGAGDQLISCVGPVMCTYGLYCHSHRALLARQLPALLALALVVAPATLLVTAAAGRALGLAPADAASALPATTTTALALMMPGGLPLIRTEWVVLGTVCVGFGTAITLPLLLRVTGLAAHSPAVRGLAIGAAAHVSGVAALASRGELAAADVASVAAVLVGTVRVALVYVPWVSDGLRLACGGGRVGEEGEEEE